MEWTGRQQVLFLLQSVGLGAAIGLFLDGIAALILRDERQDRFVLDVVFGGVTALLVFLGSLVILDGQVHPLLIFGSSIGIIAEHFLIGLWVRNRLFRVRRWLWSFANKVAIVVRKIHFRPKNGEK